MRSGFRPHYRDRMTESMEGVRMGQWAVLEGAGLQRERGFGLRSQPLGHQTTSKWNKI